MSFLHFLKSLRPHRREHWIILSVLICSLGHLLVYYIPLTLANAMIAGSGFIFVRTILKYHFRYVLTGLTSFLYSILILWSLCLTFHMFIMDDFLNCDIKTVFIKMFVTPQFFPNLIPFVILALPRNYVFDFSFLWRVMWLFAILYMCYYPYAFWNMIHYQLDMSVNYSDDGGYGDFITNSTCGISYLSPVVLMIFLKKYLRPIQWKCYMGIYVAGMLLTVYMARRGETATSLLFLLLSWVVYILADKKTSKVKAILIGVLISGCGYYLFVNLSDSIFALLLERGTIDSRSGVEDAFYTDMSSVWDWLFGRGWYGAYFDRMFMKYRLGLETGWMTLILRGGLFYLVPYISILLLSFINGFFQSKNIFCKSLAFLCLMQVVSLYPFGWPAFNFFHLTLWIGVWICNNNRYLKMSDIQIKKEVFR